MCDNVMKIHWMNECKMNTPIIDSLMRITSWTRNTPSRMIIHYSYKLTNLYLNIIIIFSVNKTGVHHNNSSSFFQNTISIIIISISLITLFHSSCCYRLKIIEIKIGQNVSLSLWLYHSFSGSHLFLVVVEILKYNGILLCCCRLVVWIQQKLGKQTYTHIHTHTQRRRKRKKPASRNQIKSEREKNRPTKQQPNSLEFNWWCWRRIYNDDMI